MLPPICFPDLATALHVRVLRHYRLLLLVAAGMTLGFGAAGALTHDLFFVRVGAALLLLSAFIALQYTVLVRDVGRLRAYARFCAWCHLQPQRPVIAMGGLVAAAALAQYVMQHRSGGLTGLVEHYGLVFADAPRQPWRYLVGPFIHASPAHWISNASLLIVAAGLSFPVGRRSAVTAVFFSGVLFPAWCLTYLPHEIGSDALLGVSGGVFALYGWIAGVALRRWRAFPSGMGVLVGAFAVVSLLVGALLEPRANGFVHAAGLAMGGLAGLSGIGVKRGPSR